jgi:hypothetical protein
MTAAPLADADVLAAWEEGLALTPAARDLLAAAEPDRDMRVEFDGGHVELRLATAGDLVAAAEAPSAAAARATLLERVVAAGELDGAPVDAAALSDDAVERIGARLAAADPLAELTLTLTCPACETGARVDFDPSDFLWREIDARARDLLEEVAALAGAYGWSEAEILGLSPARRRVYLELAGAA